MPMFGGLNAAARNAGIYGQSKPMGQPMAQASGRRLGVFDIMGAIGDVLSQNPVVTQHRMAQQQHTQDMKARMQADEAGRRSRMQDWLAQQQWERDNPAPRAPHYFQDNAGNQWTIDESGQPRLVMRDPSPRYQMVPGQDGAGNTIMTPVPIPNNVPGGPAVQRPAVGAVMADPRQGGQTPRASGNF